MKRNQITMYFGGGSLYLNCVKCHKEFAAEEVDFPGTPEQQKLPREKLRIKEKQHLETCQPHE